MIEALALLQNVLYDGQDVLVYGCPKNEITSMIIASTS